MTATAPITRDDIESKFRELQGDVEETADEAKKYAALVAIILIISFIGIAFLLGRRKGKKRATIVEIRRI